MPAGVFVINESVYLLINTCDVELKLDKFVESSARAVSNVKVPGRAFAGFEIRQLNRLRTDK
jgi:hypothetical protein